MCTIKNWCTHVDPVLSRLSRGLTDRKLLKIRFQPQPFREEEVSELRKQVAERLSVTDNEAGFFVFSGEAVNTTYNPVNERIKILFKDGQVSDISNVNNALIHEHLYSPVKKYYLCYLK
jgi:hypothetical protein